MIPNIQEFISIYKPHFVTMKKRKPISEKQVLYAIMCGDIIGTPYEGRVLTDHTKQNYQTIDLFSSHFSHSFSDDSVMSLAIYIATKNIIQQNLSDEQALQEYIRQMRKWVKAYPDAGYGFHFRQWALEDIDDYRYQSFGDGSAMRSGIIGAMFSKVTDVIKYSALASYPTHAHPEGMKGGIVTAVLVWMACHGFSEKKMRKYILKHYPAITKEKRFFNQVSPVNTIDDFTEPNLYLTLDVACQTAVPLAFINFYESSSLEECFRNCLRYDSDTDTIMAISGGIASSYFSDNKIQGQPLEKIVIAYIPEQMLQEIRKV